MKRPISTCFISLFIFLFFDSPLVAQTKDGIEVPDSTDTAVVYIDTTVSMIKVDIETDSIRSFKRDKDFAYIKYLDSLLRLKKDLAVDTFSINKQAPPQAQRERRTSAPSISFLNNSFIKIILWTLAAFFIGLILYKLFLSDILFKRKPAVKNTAVVPLAEEDVPDAYGYDKLIAKAVAEKNYRLAARYLYLQTLQMLAGKGLLQLSPDKTNYQYINEIANKPYQKDFRNITLNYEYAWYGEFEISEDVYNKLFINYRTFQQKI